MKVYEVEEFPIEPFHVLLILLIAGGILPSFYPELDNLNVFLPVI